MTHTVLPNFGQIQTKPPVSLFTPLDPEKAKEAAKTSQVLEQTLSSMKNSKNTLAQSRKAMAQQKIALIKEALKNLKQTALNDPKLLARMTARLAKELASALKEYASAGATYSEIAASSGNATPDSPTVTAENAPSRTDSTESLAAIDGMMIDGDGNAVPAEMDVEHPPASQSAFETYEKTQHFGKESGTTRTTRVKDDDNPFIKDAKEILDELRNLVKTARNKSGKKLLFRNDEAALAEKALHEAERAFTAMTASMGSVLL